MYLYGIVFRFQPLCRTEYYQVLPIMIPTLAQCYQILVNRLPMERKWPFNTIDIDIITWSRMSVFRWHCLTDNQVNQPYRNNFLLVFNLFYHYKYFVCKFASRGKHNFFVANENIPLILTSCQTLPVIGFCNTFI